MTGHIRRFRFKNRYDWKHFVEISFIDESESGGYYQDRYNLNAVLKLDFYVGDQLILSRVVTKKDHGVASGGGVTYYHRAIILLLYKCPDDLPRDKVIKCELTVVEGDKEQGSCRFQCNSKTSSEKTSRVKRNHRIRQVIPYTHKTFSSRIRYESLISSLFSTTIKSPHFAL
jgi:hypothetical protein